MPYLSFDDLSAVVYTGMVRMLRPYAPENVIGDFTNQNEFYLEDESEYSEGKATFARGPQRTFICQNEDPRKPSLFRNPAI